MPRVNLPSEGRHGAGYRSFHINTRPTGTPSSDKCVKYGRVIIFGERGIGPNAFGRI